MQVVVRQARSDDLESWTTVYRGAVGDARGSAEPSGDIAEESLGLHVDAVATHDRGVVIWTDVRDAEVCPAIDAYRDAHATGQQIAAPGPGAACPPTFGNSDIYATTVGS